MNRRKSLTSISTGNAKRRKNEPLTYFQTMLQQCGLLLRKPPEKCESTKDIVYIVRDLKQSLKEHDDYPHNIEMFITEFKTECNDKKTFEQYLYLNIIRKVNDKTYNVDSSVIKILLNVSFLQTKLLSYIFDKLLDVLDQPDFGPWVKMTLKSFSNLDTVESSEELSKKLIDLLAVSSDKFVRLEIISAIPDIIGDCEHDNVASELSKILAQENGLDISEHSTLSNSLIPSILDCLTNLCLSDTQMEQLQKETLNLMQPSNAEYFSNFVKFLLLPGRLVDSAYEETIQGLRKSLGWSPEICRQDVIATSQILTATEIRNSMLSSEAVTKAVIKAISSCQTHTDQKPIDLIFLLLIATLSDDKQKAIENLMKRLIKQQILKEELLDDAFKKFEPILKKYVTTLISLANSLLKPGPEPSVEAFGAHMHMVMYTELHECRPRIVYEMLHLVFNSKKSALNTLNILNDITSQNLSAMKSQSTQMLTLLDRLDDMSVTEVKAVMNLVCALAYSFKDSVIRHEVHIIIRKELGSCNPTIKHQGILAGVHAVKYLMKSPCRKVNIPEHVTLTMTSCLPEGDLREAAQIIELIHDSTAQFAYMLTFFYDELYYVIDQATAINENFLAWLTTALTTFWDENFLVNKIEEEHIGNVRLSMQLELNEPSEVDDVLAVNIAGVALEDNREINIEVLSSLFRLVRALHYKKENGDLSEIDALLGCAIVMPIVDIDDITGFGEFTKKILKCYVLSVNWIREILNAFITQKDVVLKCKIIKRIAQLRDLEETINKIRVKAKKPDNDMTTTDTSKSQQTQMTQTAKHGANDAIKYRPLDLTLLHVIEYDLTHSQTSEEHITFESLTYILSYINVSLEKVLIPQIKKNTFNKDIVQIYNYSEAEKQAQVVNKILHKLMAHIDVIVAFLDRHLIEEETMELETLEDLHILESLHCLEHIYGLLSIYFRWIDLKNKNIPMLKSSLQIVAKVDDDGVLLEELLTAVAKVFQEHKKYMITISSATALMKLMKAVRGLSKGSEVPTILKDLAFKFLSQEQKILDHQQQKGTVYNQYLETLTGIYLDNNTLQDLKEILISLVDEVGNVRDKGRPLQTLKCITKDNFNILFRKLGVSLRDKTKSRLLGCQTDEERFKLWEDVAYINKLMSDIVITLDNKSTSTSFFKLSNNIWNLFLHRGFPILKTAFPENREKSLEMLSRFQTCKDCLENICSQPSNKALMQKIPDMKKKLTTFIYKTKDLLKSNNCLEALKMCNVKRTVNVRKKSKKVNKKTVSVDETIQDSEDDFSEDETNLVENDYIGSVGVSDLLP